MDFGMLIQFHASRWSQGCIYKTVVLRTKLDQLVKVSQVPSFFFFFSIFSICLLIQTTPLIKIFFNIFIYLGVLGLSCSTQDHLDAACEVFRYGMWDLVSWPRMEPGPPALEAQTLSHWTTREVPTKSLFSTFHPVSGPFIQSHKHRKKRCFTKDRFCTGC